MRRVPAILGAALLAGCSWVPFVEEKTPDAPTLADLEPAVIPDASGPPPRMDIDTLIATYREVLAETDDPVLELQVRQRLAGLQILRGEEELYEDQSSESPFALAISAYTDLLEQDPQRADNDRLLYQLSKAHDLSADSDQALETLNRLVREHPESSHFVEAQFRRGEIFFSRGDYLAAEQAYGSAIERGVGTPYYRNALYMHGWSLFKLNRYRGSLASFTGVLDLLVPEDAHLDGLSPGERELVADSLRVMSVVFAWLDGPATIADVYAELGERHYQHLIYDALGNHYLEQERYQDSADTYRTFVERHPASPWAPLLSVKLIESYSAGDFPERVLEEKENFVARYGLGSDFRKSADTAMRESVAPHLKTYLSELARHYHALAQAGSRELQALESADEIPVKERSEKDEAVDPEVLRGEVIANYRRAGDYYQNFITTFPNAAEVPEMMYLLAEARFESQDYPGAIEAYETVAYEYSDHRRGADAGYAAVVAFDKLLESIPAEENEAWRQLKITSELRFAQRYASDPRAPAVLTRAAEELLELEDYAGAVVAAGQLLEREPPAEPELRRTAWLVSGHGEFETGNFAAAETAYMGARQLMEPGSEQYAAVTDRLAASVFRQAEAAAAAGEHRVAAASFLRVGEVAPQSEIRIAAQYDAASQLLEVEDYAAAIGILEGFRRSWPEHQLSTAIPARLAEAYQQTGQWGAAADEVLLIAGSETDPEAQREAVYLAAELYEKAGDRQAAIQHYRRYVETWPQPFPIATEARFRLSELYRETDEPGNRRTWLRRLIDTDAAAGAARTDRSRYLAAMASAVLADDAFEEFARIRLSLPLKESLARKKKGLNRALDAYRQTADYGVEEFTTLATFRIGEIYGRLSRDLLDSERPENLDALAMEQYQLLLEEQAFPFEEKAIEIHETNTRRSWNGVYDDWVRKSFSALAVLLPARYGKTEEQLSVSNEIY